LDLLRYELNASAPEAPSVCGGEAIGGRVSDDALEDFLTGGSVSDDALEDFLNGAGVGRKDGLLMLGAPVETGADLLLSGLEV